MWDGLFYVSTIGCLCIWLNIILDVSVRVFFSSSSDHSYFLNINFRYTVQWLDIYVICEVTPLNYSSTYVALYTAIMIIMTKFPILYSKVSVDFCLEMLVGEIKAEARGLLNEAWIGSKEVETVNEDHSWEWEVKKWTIRKHYWRRLFF